MNISQMMHRSPAAVGMIAVAMLYVIISGGIGDQIPAQGDQGICLPPPTMWSLPYWIDTVGGILLNIGLLLMMALINKNFNVLRSNTRLQLGLFAIIAASIPRLVVNVNSGVLLALAVNVFIFLMFSCYDNPRDTSRVFLGFLIISCGATMQYCFTVFIPIGWIIAAQMKIFNLRTFLASIFGILTPWIILLGFGIVGPDDFHEPQVIDIFRAFEENSAFYLLTITAFTSSLVIIAIILNLSRTISYNSRARAFNGALTVVALVTILSIVFNYNNFFAYLPLLNVCAAYQVTHLLVNHKFEKQYLVVLAIIFIYFAFYTWRLFL